MDERLRRLQQIDTENLVWIIYLFLIGFCFYANKLEKEYYLTGNPKKKEEYRRLIIFIFSVAVIIYFYFFVDNYQDVKNLSPNDSHKKKTLNQMSLLASSFIFISGLIFLFIAISDTELDVELVFN